MPRNATVLMIRHAEKPVTSGDRTLSVPGQERAQAYVTYFQHLTLDGSGPLKLNYLFATADSDHSHRPRLTIKPLAQALPLPINDKHEDGDYPKVVAHLEEPKYDGATILICWHHEKILDFARALGVEPAALPPESRWPTQGWPDDIYGWVLQLRYGTDGKVIPAQTRCWNQRLMYNDHGRDP